MKRLIVLCMILCVALSAAACKKQPAKPEADKAAAPAKEKPAEPQKELTLDEILAEIPCKLNEKRGPYAVFKDNPAAGQNCFSLTVAKEGETAPVFDIKTNEFMVVVRDETWMVEDLADDDVAFMKYESHDGVPCLAGSCGKTLPYKAKVYSDPADPNLSYLIVTPEEPLPLEPSGDVFYGFAMGGMTGRQDMTPVFK